MTVGRTGEGVRPTEVITVSTTSGASTDETAPVERGIGTGELYYHSMFKIQTLLRTSLFA